MSEVKEIEIKAFFPKIVLKMSIYSKSKSYQRMFILRLYLHNLYKVIKKLFIVDKKFKFLETLLILKLYLNNFLKLSFTTNLPIFIQFLIAFPNT